MNLRLRSKINKVLILGAGSSVEYGLPLWKDLSFLIHEKINKDTENRYKYKKEIVSWLNKVGEDKEYETIDRCIEKGINPPHEKRVSAIKGVKTLEDIRLNQ
jgi:hypothetical protein